MNKKETLVAFLEAWANQDYEKMYELSQKTWQDGNDAKKMELLYEPVKLKEFNIFSETYVSNSSMKYNVDLTLENGAKVIAIANVICEVAPGTPAAYGDWGVNPVSVQKVVANIPAKKKGKSNAKK